jgi:hypothetical protein
LSPHLPKAPSEGFWGIVEEYFSRHRIQLIVV